MIYKFEFSLDENLFSEYPKDLKYLKTNYDSCYCRFYKKNGLFSIQYNRYSDRLDCYIFCNDIYNQKKVIELFLNQIPVNKILNYLKECGFWFKNAKITKDFLKQEIKSYLN